MLSDEGLSALQPCWGAIMRSQPFHPSASVNMVTRRCKQIESHFQKPALSPHYKSRQAEPAPEPVQRTFLSSVLFALCLSISFMKSIWKFLSIFILGNPGTPTLVTISFQQMVVVIVTGCPYSVGCTSCVLVYLQKRKRREQEKRPLK